MPTRILMLLAIVCGCLAFAGSAQAKPPCSDQPCVAHLTATNHAKHWKVRGRVGEAWLLYLNIYEAGHRLAYLRLSGGCDASYASADVAAVLHACGARATLDYAALGKPTTLRVVYRYVRR